MNLGQILGEMKLRIWQLEDELEERGGRRVPRDATVVSLVVPEAPRETVAAPDRPRMVEGVKRRRQTERGIGERVRAAVPVGPPGLTLAEIRERMDPGVPVGSVSGFLAYLDDVVREGEPRHYRYYRKVAAGSGSV